MELLQGLLSRRSVAPKDLADQAPTDSELTQILTAALRVPDHGKLAPWRLVMFDKPAQVAFSEAILVRFRAIHPNASDAEIIVEAKRATRAPLMIAVLSTPSLGKIPVWEQELSAGAVCMNLLHACHALGYGAKWLTEWLAYDVEILSILGGAPQDRIAGFIYIGKPVATPEERERPRIEDKVIVWRALS
jgi:nitroreductase